MNKHLLAVPLLAAGCASQAAPTVPRAPVVPPVRAVALEDGTIDAAQAVVQDALSDADPLARANAVEAAAAAGDRAAVVDALDDPDARVRFAAAMSVGRDRIDLPGVRESLVRMAEDTSPNGRVAAVFALHRLGDTSRSQTLTRTARSDDPIVRANTAVALGLTGEPSAKPVLAAMLQDFDANVRLNAAEAMWRLGDDRGLQSLLAASIGSYSDDRVIGALGLAASDSPVARAALKGKLTDDYPEVALAAARGLGRLGSDAGYGVALRESTDAEPRRRALAALAFGDIGRADARDALVPLLAVEQPDAVRLAAATAVLQLAQSDRLAGAPVE